LRAPFVKDNSLSEGDKIPCFIPAAPLAIPPEVNTADIFSDNLPGATLIVAAAKVPDMVWIWEVFGFAISSWS
jgi:hypothetical protein